MLIYLPSPLPGSDLKRLSPKYQGRLEFLESPRYILFGPGAIEKSAETLMALGISGKALIVTGGPKTEKIAWKLGEALEQEGHPFHLFRIGEGEPTPRVVEGAAEAARREGCSFVVAVGGGRALDVGKLASHWVGMKYLSVPTSASHDGMASPSVGFLLSRAVSEYRGPEWARPESPTAVIADTEVIKNAPDWTMRAGFGDLIAKVTAVRDWELAHRLKDEPYSEYAASMSLLSARLAVEHAGDLKPGLEESVRLLVKALIGSGVAISIAGSSRPASGSEHLFSHAIDLLSQREGVSRAPHGIQCGLGAIMMAYLQGQDWRMIRSKLEEAGAPITAREAGLDPEVVVRALTLAHRVRDRYTILGETGLTESAARKLAERTGVI